MRYRQLRDAVLAVVAVAAIGAAAGGIDRTLTTSPAGNPVPEIFTFSPSPPPPSLAPDPVIPAPARMAVRARVMPSPRPHPATARRPALARYVPARVPARRHCRGKRRKH
jgi:hypothetical protein